MQRGAGAGDDPGARGTHLAHVLPDTLRSAPATACPPVLPHPTSPPSRARRRRVCGLQKVRPPQEACAGAGRAGGSDPGAAGRAERRGERGCAAASGCWSRPWCAAWAAACVHCQRPGCLAGVPTVCCANANAGEDEQGPTAFVMRELLREEAPFTMLVQTGQVCSGRAGPALTHVDGCTLHLRWCSWQRQS